MYVLSDTHACYPLRHSGERILCMNTLCMCDTILPHHTKCRHKMPFPTLTSSQSHPDFTLGISYHSADFRILACTSDHNCWSSTGKRVKITLLQSKHIKDKKSHISFYHKERTSNSYSSGLLNHMPYASLVYLANQLETTVWLSKRP